MVTSPLESQLVLYFQYPFLNTCLSCPTSPLGARCLRYALVDFCFGHVCYSRSTYHFTRQFRLEFALSLPICLCPFCRRHNLGLHSSPGVSRAESPIFRPNALRSHSRRNVLLLPSFLRPFSRHRRALEYSLDCRQASIYWLSMHSSSDYQAIR